MRNELHYYDIYPKVIEVNKTKKITIVPLDERYNFGEDRLFTIKIDPLEQFIDYSFHKDNTIECISKNNKIIFEYNFNSEQEYYINIYDEASIEEKRAIIQLSIYAAEADLYKRIPLKGDLHVHSCRSDGKESPAVVAANYRKAGFDFFALTDHGQYKPSKEARDAYNDVNIDLNIINGEEVHSPDNYVHIVNFGGAYSVNELFQKDEESFRAEVNELVEVTEVHQNVDPFIYCSCILVANKIREGNGLPIFCHPYWIYGTYNVPTRMSYEILNNDVCDAFELLGGQTVHENNMQLALWGELRANGKKLAIVGNSDSHGTINSGWFLESKTIVFANNNEKNEIIKSIKDYYSIAVEHYNGESYRVHGPLRLVAYTRFLLENYFPLHDELCKEEGRLMNKYYIKERGAKEKLEELSRRCENLYNKYFK